MVENSYTEETIQGYLDRLASAEPEPGGGSAAALVGALGAALVTMVTALTLGKEKFASIQEEMRGLRAKAEAVRDKLQDLVTLDARAYGAVAAAMKLPKGTPEQKAVREQELQVALKGAAEVPLRVAEAALAVAQLSLPAAEMGNPHAVSDAGVAAILADAAAQSAALNVRINLVWINDQEFNRLTWIRIDAILSEIAGLRDDVLTLTNSKL
jgi:formiminotetrahydrofolate cyclodeaminase